jgi:hypothetical protein
MENLRNWFKGKKTYVLGGVAIVGAIASYLVGDIELTTAAEAVWTGLVAMTIRAGIAK